MSVCAGCVLGIHSNTAYQSPRGTEPADCAQRFVGNIQQLPSSRYSACLFIYLFIPSYLCLHFNATRVCSCHSLHADCHVHGDVRDRGIYSLPGLHQIWEMLHF